MSVTLATEQPFHNIARQMGRLVDQLQKGYSNFAPGEVWTPSVNLYETDAAYLVCVDLAGVEKDKIDITVDHHVLKLHGRRAVPTQHDQQNHTDHQESAHQTKMRVHLMEIDHGSFSREVELPMDVKQDKISAHYHNGLLWVHLPKK
jgi:HSP20 family protein